MLEGLRNRYRADLPAKIEALEFARTRQEDDEGREAIRRMAHSLAGSGGTYGFPEITRLARSVETAADDELYDSVADLIELLRRIAASDETEYGAEGLLLVADDLEYAERVDAKMASRGRQLHVADDIQTARQAVDEEEIDLILLDVALEGGAGAELLVELRSRADIATIPVFVVTAETSGLTQAESYAMGADAFFDKAGDIDLLAAAVASRLQRDRRLRDAARRDRLTGLPNRAAVAEEFERTQARARRTGEPVSIALLDLDHFKRVNDTYGHPTGDKALRKIAKMLATTLRGSDYVGRWGGEEIVVLLPGADEPGAVAAVRGVLRTVQETELTTADGQDTFRLTFSAGVVETSEETTLDEALELADERLYQAKRAGRARVVASSGSEPSVQERATKVPIAEDDESIAALLSHRLRRDGYQVSRFADGNSAWAALREQEFDVAVLDVYMPGMRGTELLEKIRAVDRGKRLPVILVTAAGREEDVLKGFELGADDYVVKPFSVREVLARVRRLTPDDR